MRVVTYYQDCGQPYPTTLMSRWVHSWQSAGFEPVICNLEQAKAHPKFPQVEQWAATSPTVNDRTFESACWLRWCAYALAAEALFVDYDVINYSLKPGDVPVGDFAYMGAACVFATRKGIEGFIDFMPSTPVGSAFGKPHVSDLDAMIHYHQRKYCTCAGLPDETTAPLVHFGNAYLKQEWKFNNRWKAVDDLRRRRAGSNK